MEVVLRVSVKGSTFFTTYAIMYHHSFLLERRAWLATSHMISALASIIACPAICSVTNMQDLEKRKKKFNIRMVLFLSIHFSFYPFSIVSRFEIKLPEFICVTWQKVEKKRRSSGIGVAVEDCEGNSKAFKSLSPPSK